MTQEINYYKVMRQKGVIYIRVSSAEQTLGFSLESQLESCQEFAERKGIDVIKVFEDPGFSAKTLNRPGLKELLDYCRENKSQISTLIVYKVDRVSRQTSDYLAIRKQLADFGIDLISSSGEPIGEDTPSGKFLETILAAVAQMENDSKSKRSISGMKKRFESGFASSTAPVGYINSVNENGRKVISPDPDQFEKVQTCWQLMGTGQYSLSQMAEKMNKMGITSRYHKKRHKIRAQTTQRLFRSKFYCGYISSKRWGEIAGKHEKMIPEWLFYKVQDVLGAGPSRDTIDNTEFPLRRIVKCNVCGKGLTGGWSKGKNKKYRYYRCYSKDHKTTSIPANKMEDALVALLRTFTPSSKFYAQFTALIKADYAKKVASLKAKRAGAKRELEDLKDQLKILAYKNLQGNYPNDLYQEMKGEIESQMLVKRVIIGDGLCDIYDLEALLNFMSNFINDLGKAWLNGTEGQRRVLLSSIFEKNLRWNYPNYIEHQIKPIFKAFQTNSIKPLLLSDPGGI